MIVTEQEAATKWCPKAIGRDEHPWTSGNRWYSGEKESYEPVATCLGSRCMSWRWFGDNPRYRTHVCADVKAVAEPARPDGMPAAWTWSPYDPAEGDPACWVEDDTTAMSRLRGFCGLAYSVRLP